MDGDTTERLSQKVNAQKMASMAYWREHPLSLEVCLEEKHTKGCKLFRLCNPPE